MNRKQLWVVFLTAVMACVSACSSNHSTPPAISVSVSGATTILTGATGPYTATVSNDSANAGVNWSCSTTGAAACSASNFSPAQTASGTATTFTAPASAETVTITATSVTDSTKSGSVNVTVGASGTNYSFYAAGTDSDDFNYTLAGSVTIDSNGNVLTGEQDFNDGAGVTSPEPSGDSITGGTLTVDPTTHQGTLTLETNNDTLGTETLAVSFANPNHALVEEFDGIASSNGSLDLQTSLTGMPSGSFSFAGAGVAVDGTQVVAGGVFTITSGTMSGTIDTDDDGNPSLGAEMSGTVTAPDSFGRGTITNSNFGITVNYYVVGPEVVRIIDADETDIFVGSAYGQGAGGFGPASIGTSVVSISGISIFEPYALAGQITTTPSGLSFSGVADVDEFGNVVSASTISGTYAMASNGYGNITITNAGAEDASVLGVYAVDPSLNISDPNNSSGGGGALVVDLDTNIFGVGVLVPQTDTTAADFSGNYAFDAQLITPNDEADLLGQGNVSGTTFSGTGVLNDPFADFINTALNTGVTFSGTVAADGSNPGRFELSPLNMSITGSAPIPLTVVIYQASGGQLFWIETDEAGIFSGQLQLQAFSQAAARRAATKVTPKH